LLDGGDAAANEPRPTVNRDAKFEKSRLLLGRIDWAAGKSTQLRTQIRTEG